MDIVEQEGIVTTRPQPESPLKKVYELPTFILIEPMEIQGGQAGNREASGLWES